jgi:hypothetical protein
MSARKRRDPFAAKPGVSPEAGTDLLSPIETGAVRVRLVVRDIACWACGQLSAGGTEIRSGHSHDVIKLCPECAAGFTDNLRALFDRVNR